MVLFLDFLFGVLIRYFTAKQREIIDPVLYVLRKAFVANRNCTSFVHSRHDLQDDKKLRVLFDCNSIAIFSRSRVLWGLWLQKARTKRQYTRGLRIILHIYIATRGRKKGRRVRLIDPCGPRRGFIPDVFSLHDFFSQLAFSRILFSPALANIVHVHGGGWITSYCSASVHLIRST